MTYPFQIVDVFTPVARAGNQLAVVTDARGLSTAQMQSIAREFGFAETSFVLPPANAAHDAHVRIFTPEEEMPFAGHPNVGTAYVLGRMGSLFDKPIGQCMVFEEAAGLVAAETVQDPAGVILGGRCRAPRRLSIGTQVPTAVVAELSGLAERDLLTGRFKPCFASVGAEFLLAETSADALERARPSAEAFARYEGRIGQSAGLLGLHLHVRDPNDPSRIDVRMFAPLAGVPEDAATGSAAAALGAFLNSLDPAQTRFTLSQGRHMGRPSEIEVEADGEKVWIGGPCAPFATGHFLA